jgi:hypothetical protein
MRNLAAALIAIPLGACGTTGEPTQADLRATWEERNVQPVNYKADIVAVMRTYLNDPSGVRNAGVTPAARKFLPGDPGERYASCLRYTAKDSTGKYAAAKTVVVVYANGKLDRVLDPPAVAREVCKDAEFEPFRELEQLKR